MFKISDMRNIGYSKRLDQIDPLEVFVFSSGLYMALDNMPVLEEVYPHYIPCVDLSNGDLIVLPHTYEVEPVDAEMIITRK